MFFLTIFSFILCQSDVKTAIALLCYDLPFNTGNIFFDQSGKFDVLKKKSKTVLSVLTVFLSTGMGGGGEGGLRELRKAGQRYVGRSGDI